MKLALKTFAQLIEDMGAALQASASVLVDLSVGSMLRAIFEANASVALWMQWLILQVLQTTRAATSTGTDLDSWMADFGLTRLPAVPSSGVATFSRYSANISATIPVGAIIKTSDGSLSFAVTKDTSNSIWSPSLEAYVIPSGIASADLPVSCTAPGQVGNVLANSVTMIAASLPGVDLVTNANPFANGIDAESDGPFRGRFSGYLAGLSRATDASIISAVESVRQGLNVRLLENSAADGSPRPGSFVVLVDDGSGYPSNGLLSALATAVDSVRPVATTFAILAPQVINVDVSLTVTVAVPSSTAVSLSAVIQASVEQYLNSLAIGRLAAVTRIAQAAYAADPTVENVSEVLLNGTSTDVSPGPTGVVKSRNIMVTINVE